MNYFVYKNEAVTLCKSHNLISGHAFSFWWQKTSSEEVNNRHVWEYSTRLKTFLLSLAATKLRISMCGVACMQLSFEKFFSISREWFFYCFSPYRGKNSKLALSNERKSVKMERIRQIVYWRDFSFLIILVFFFKVIFKASLDQICMCVEIDDNL